MLYVNSCAENASYWPNSASSFASARDPPTPVAPRCGVPSQVSRSTTTLTLSHVTLNLMAMITSLECMLPVPFGVRSSSCLGTAPGQHVLGCTVFGRSGIQAAEVLTRVLRMPRKGSKYSDVLIFQPLYTNGPIKARPCSRDKAFPSQSFPCPASPPRARPAPAPGQHSSGGHATLCTSHRQQA